MKDDQDFGTPGAGIAFLSKSSNSKVIQNEVSISDDYYIDRDTDTNIVPGLNGTIDLTPESDEKEKLSVDWNNCKQYLWEVPKTDDSWIETCKVFCNDFNVTHIITISRVFIFSTMTNNYSNEFFERRMYSMRIPFTVFFHTKSILIMVTPLHHREVTEGEKVWWCIVRCALYEFIIYDSSLLTVCTSNYRTYALYLR